MTEEELVVPTEEERQNLIKYARHTALASDRICQTILSFTSRLEELNIIPKDRKTKRERDRHMRDHMKQFEIPSEKIEELLQKVKDHPDPEMLVASLFRNLNVRRVKNIMAKISNKTDKNNSEEEEDAE